jgi:hypothetical protein
MYNNKWKQFNGKLPEYPCGTPYYKRLGSFYVGGINTLTTNPNFRRLGLGKQKTSDASTIWTADARAAVRGVAVDSSGNVYTCGDRFPGDTVEPESTIRKWDKNGVLIWRVPTSETGNCTVHDIAVDSLGNVYTAAVNCGGLGLEATSRKFDSNGNQVLWVGAYTQNIDYGIDVDSSGNFYVGSKREVTGTTRKYDGTKTGQKGDASGANSAIIWVVDHGADVFCLRVDSSGNVYTGGARTAGNITTRKYDTNGNLIWSVDHGASVLGIAVDNLGNVYTGGVRTGNLTTRKYDSSGNLIWSVDHGAQVNSVAVDPLGNVYTGGATTNTITTRKYNSSGTLIWSADHRGSNFDTTGIYSVAVDQTGYFT